MKVYNLYNFHTFIRFVLKHFVCCQVSVFGRQSWCLGALVNLFLSLSVAWGLLVAHTAVANRPLVGMNQRYIARNSNAHGGHRL